MSLLTDSQYTDLGGAVSDIFGAAGAMSSASAYETAAKIASSNADITLRSGQIQAEQEQRTVFQALGAEKATTAGAGFNTTSGSAGDLLRSSVQQGALAKQLIVNQSEITAQGFEQQAAAYKGQAGAAKTSAGGGILGGLIKVAGIFGI